MEVQPEQKNQDVDLMAITQEIIIQSPTTPATEKYLSGEQENVPLGGCLIMDMQNLSFDELQKKILQARKKHFFNDLTSLLL